MTLKTLTNPSLHARLEKYQAAAQTDQDRTWQQWLDGWRTFAAAAGASVALATAAEAGIIYSGPNRDVSATASGPGSVKKIASASFGGLKAKLRVYDFQFQFKSYNINLKGATNYHREVNVAFSQSNDRIFRELGSPVTKTHLYGGFADRLAFGANVAGSKRMFASHRFLGPSFRENLPQTGFVGLELKTLNGYDYGWIRIRLSDDPSNPKAYDGLPHKVTLVDWAYATGGVPIYAGEGAPTPTPEPASASLALLAAGSCGVLALRRGRRSGCSADRA